MGKKKVREAPKKSKMITGYIIYASEIRREIIKANPDKEFGDISKIVGIEWRKLGQEEKVMFEKRAEEQNSLFRDEFSKMSELANEAVANAVAAGGAATTGAPTAPGVAPELDKLADVAAERAANEQTRQQRQAQHQHQQQHPQEATWTSNQQHQDGSFVNNTTSQDSSSFMSTATNQHQQQSEQQLQHSFMSSQEHSQQQSQLRSPLPNNAMSQYASSVANYNAAATYSQQSAYYSQLMMGQSTPTSLVRPAYGQGAATGGPNDLLLQQQHQQPPLPLQSQVGQPSVAPPSSMTQQPFSLVQQQHTQQPATTVQYCNNPACCASGRYQPYPPYPYSPPEPPVTPSALQQQLVQSPPIKLSPTHHQQIQQQHPQTPQHLQYKMNNIIYRKPSQVRLRPKDAGTQTDPMPWAGKLEGELESPKKRQLRFSKEFIQYLHLNRLGGGGGSAPPPAKLTAECHW